MKRLKLGDTGIEVSEFCLGTMTWGSQNTEAEGHAQMDRALAAGCDFWDTAEMYPVNPVAKETVGDTESIVGSWIARTGRRSDVVLATKCSGYNEKFVREGQPVTGATLRAALNGSLQRLNTDYVDLYQLHWPNRGSYHFRRIWNYDPTAQVTTEIEDNMADVMQTLRALVDEGKIRAFGLSNETAWGTMKWNAAAAATGGPRVASMQNEYSLLCRAYDTDMAETAHNEDVTLLAYTPLAAGLLSGKYQKGDIPSGSRMSLNPDLGGRKTDRAAAAVDAYLAVAAKHGLNPAQMALAWTRTRPFTTIPIFGATSLAQLDLALGAADVTLSDHVLDDIAATHRLHPMPF
ncbi:aldo/keto reductase [Oceaniglobus indicus]|uniref:aldo/keto reductase n=1 Tax=Oceaniglobus indicus TaxID=2047749 RepID=UPI000C181370|nr:aldo/keto reductase [Oceaniglobus indicus]